MSRRIWVAIFVCSLAIGVGFLVRARSSLVPLIRDEEGGQLGKGGSAEWNHAESNVSLEGDRAAHERVAVHPEVSTPHGHNRSTVEGAAMPTTRGPQWREFMGRPVHPNKSVVPIVCPETRAQRECFVQFALVDQQSVVDQLCGSDLPERYRSKIKPDLSHVDAARAHALVLDLVEAEHAYRTAVNDCLRTYVLDVEDLRVPRRKPGKRGRSGTVAIGAKDDPVWGTEPCSVKVAYFLAYEDYPQLDATKRRLRELQKRFSEYSD